MVGTMVSATGSCGYTTRFPQEAKDMQLGRQVVFESVDGGRIHRQVFASRPGNTFGKDWGINTNRVVVQEDGKRAVVVE